MIEDYTRTLGVRVLERRTFWTKVRAHGEEKADDHVEVRLPPHGFSTALEFVGPKAEIFLKSFLIFIL